MAATYSPSHEHIDLEVATHRGILVNTTLDFLSEAMAEVAPLLMLASARNASRRAVLVRGRLWPVVSAVHGGMLLTGKRLGIHGMGAVGREIASRARASGVQLGCYRESRLRAALEAVATDLDSLEAWLTWSEILSVAAPSSATKRASINRHNLPLLPCVRSFQASRGVTSSRRVWCWTCWPAAIFPACALISSTTNPTSTRVESRSPPCQRLPVHCPRACTVSTAAYLSAAHEIFPMPVFERVLVG